MNKTKIPIWLKATLATLGVFIGIGLFFWVLVIYPTWTLVSLMAVLVIGTAYWVFYSIWREFYDEFKWKEGRKK